MSECADKNTILLENLLNRLLKDKSTGSFSLPGIITEDERAAMVAAKNSLEQFALEATLVTDAFEEPEIVPEIADIEQVAEIPASSPPNGEVDASIIVEPVISSKGIEALLDTSVLTPASFSPNLHLGLDFGTAYSKACMIQVKDDEEIILDLPLGIYAGEDALQMPVHSALFIDPDGRLYFGPIAVEKSLEARESGAEIARIDSIKSFLIDENRVTIDDSPLSKIYNPTSTEISKAALLTFYLGYLLYLVREAATERHGVDIGTVQRRISLPCYAPHHRDKVVKELSKLFTLGEVLGKSFRDEWETGFRIEDVKYLYDWMRTKITKNSPYIEYFLEEPLAVAGSRLSMQGKSSGNVCMVVDVGAGTTDFTMIEIFADARSGFTSARQVKNSEYGVPVAGDKLDKILLAYIFRDAGISRASENYRAMLVSLQLDIRDYKERLFRHNVLTYSLLGGITGEITLSDFLQDKAVKAFSSELRGAFVKVLSSIHPSWIKTKIRQRNFQSRLPVILTGGGSGLPMVRNLAKGSIDVHGYSIDLFLSPGVPKWIEDEYEGEIIDLYPQMAVSLGSAKKYVIDKSVVREEFA